MKRYLEKPVKEPSLKEVGKRFLMIVISVGTFTLGVILLFKWILLRQVVPKIVFNVVFCLLFLILIGVFILFIIACVRYIQTEINRQKTVFKRAVKKVKGGENKWQ